MSLTTLPPRRKKQESGVKAKAQPTTASRAHPSISVEPLPTKPSPLAWRYEFKFLVPRIVRTPLLADLRRLLHNDAHVDDDGSYTVRSLYFDSRDWSSFYSKLNGLPVREKLRIRIYNVGTERASAPKFEIKFRRNDRIAKRTALVSWEDYKDIIVALKNGYGATTDRGLRNQALDSFLAYCARDGRLPVVNVQFRRVALISRTDRQLRVTVDDQLRACRARDLYDDMSGAWSMNPAGESILEIKTSGLLPAWFLFLARKFNLQRQPVSKYGRAIQCGPFGVDGLI